MASSQARFDMTTDPDGRHVLVVEGDWTVFTVGAVDRSLRNAARSEREAHVGIQAVDVTGLEKLDTAGAYIIERTLRGSRDSLVDESGEPAFALIGEHASALSLLKAASHIAQHPLPVEKGESGFIGVLRRAGMATVALGQEALGILHFIGESFATIVRLLARPHKIRWTSVVAVMEDAGLDALPIVSMLSFFIGLVIAFLGVNLLQQFGAQIFTVEMVGILMLREFGVVLTAILLAGRTDSSFTAQIGAMKMREEIDAMRVLGLDPMEVLVAPRILALMVMTPFLAFAATVSGIVGGMLVLWGVMDISPAMFIQRIHETVPGTHFWVGIVKAPVFAMVVALVGCRQGLLVSGDVQTLGQRTTASVVQSIFLVIVLDALFAIMYLEMDI